MTSRWRKVGEDGRLCTTLYVSRWRINHNLALLEYDRSLFGSDIKSFALGSSDGEPSERDPTEASARDTEERLEEAGPAPV